jgi:hypothetical protein
MHQKLGLLALKLSVISVLAVIVLSAVGCNTECVDKFDCQTRGSGLMCSKGACVTATDAGN